MGRWTQSDTDAQRLPEGMQRIGYDSETRRYTFKDADGAVYEGDPGAEFGGNLRLVSHSPHKDDNDNDNDGDDDDNGDDEPIRLMPNSPVPLPSDLAHSPVTSSPTSFRDFLPASAITSASSPPPSPSSLKSPASFKKSFSPPNSPLARSHTAASTATKTPKKSVWSVVRTATLSRMSRRTSTTKSAPETNAAAYQQLHDDKRSLTGRK